jgi:hypothetical protein
MMESQTTAFFVFKGEDDRNVRTLWPGELPRLGELVQLNGRDTLWSVSEVKWLFNIEPKDQRFQRAVVITLEKVTLI